MTPKRTRTSAATDIRSRYSPTERAILARYLERSDPHSVDIEGIDPAAPVDPEEWDESRNGIGPLASPMEDDRLIVENAVARICLEAVRLELPQWVGMSGGRVVVGRRHSKRRTRRRLRSRRLLTINWANSGPGFSWPEEYRLTLLPGYDTFIVTASNDCPDVRGYCDVAIGHFTPGDDDLENAGSCIVDWWRGLAMDDQSRWAELIDAGEVGARRAKAWADEIWGPDEDDEDEYDEEAEDSGAESTSPNTFGAGPLVLPVIPFSLEDCTLVQAPTRAQAAAHAAHVRAHPTPCEFWTHAPYSDWMLDLARQYWHQIPVAPERELRTFALECAEGLQAIRGEALLKLLEAVRLRIAGKLTLGELTPLQRSLQPHVTPGGVQGLPRCSPESAAALAAWHTANRNPYDAAFWAAEFAALHDGFIAVTRAAEGWTSPEDRGEAWRASWRLAFFNRAHPDVLQAAAAETRRRQADRLRELLPSPFTTLRRSAS